MDPIELLRRFQGTLTQEEYAERLGISQSYLSSMYSGQRKVSYTVLVALARAFPKSKRDVARLFFDPDYRYGASSAAIEIAPQDAAQ